MTSLLPPQYTLGTIALAGTGLLFAYCILYCVYNVFWHPLRKFPGPLLWRATYFPFLYHMVRGDLSFKVSELSEKYGAVVRINPAELAFTDADAWQQIYGHRSGAQQGAEEFPKPPVFYHARGIPPSIISESRENHTLLRRQLAHGFSDRAMHNQEPLIGRYADLLIQRLREHCLVKDATTGTQDTEKKGQVVEERAEIDIMTWYNWTTFDIISDLAFGEPLGSLEQMNYHPWVGLINKSLGFACYVLCVKYLGLEGPLISFMRMISKSRNAHDANTKAMLERRMALPEGRDDLIEGLLKKKSDWNIDVGRLRTTSSTLLIAGSETTATLLTGVTHLLLANPDKLKRLTAEVRSTFKSSEEITLISVGSLKYMLACLNEALRYYPPVPIGLPRMVPKGGATVIGHDLPEDTIVACWQWAMYHSTRNWVEPDSFIPERFLPEGKNELDRHDSLQPFHVGPRNCIGRNLAYAEMRLILARIIYNFDMELVHPEKNWLKNQKAHLLWTKPPLPIYLTPVA